MSSKEQDYYAILQVDAKAEAEVISAAYRRLASRYHPDVNAAADAGDRMRQINAAYEVLSDPQARARYDAERRLAASRTLSVGTLFSKVRRLRNWLIALGVVVCVLLISRVAPQPILLVGLFMALLLYYILSGKWGQKD